MPLTSVASGSIPVSAAGLLAASETDAYETIDGLVRGVLAVAGWIGVSINIALGQNALIEDLCRLLPHALVVVTLRPARYRRRATLTFATASS